MIVSWFSAGVSSAVATWLIKDKIDRVIYIDIEDQHDDTPRFLSDCENWIGQGFEKLSSPYKSVENVIKQFRYINGVAGAKCTQVLKKRVREEWELEHRGEDISYVWGYDLDEKHRIERIIERYPNFNHIFPLAEHNLKKQDAHAILARHEIKRPKMYDLGYQNNNCIGCVKGGMGYWNRIRKDFPDVFKSRAKLERKIGASCINGTYLDELQPDQGIFEQDIPQDCGMFCYMLDRED